MLGKIRTLAGDLANAVTIWGLIGTLGVSGILGIVGPTVLQPILELPAGLRVVLGLCIFLAALAVIVTALRAALHRQSRDKDTKAIASQSSEYSLWQELKRVEKVNQQLRDALQQSEANNENLRDWISKLEPFMWRLHLKWGLETIGRMGRNLSEKEQPDAVAMERWVSLTSGLIRKHYDDETADFFLVHDGDSSFAGRLARLQEVADKAAAFMDAPKATHFDVAEALEPYPQEWSNKYGA
jgi:hypothetical protein